MVAGVVTAGTALVIQEAEVAGASVGITVTGIMAVFDVAARGMSACMMAGMLLVDLDAVGEWYGDD